MDHPHESIEEPPKAPPKSSIEHLVNALNAHEAQSEADGESPRKKQRRTPPSVAVTNDVQVSRKGRACMACRRLKVKCDSAERGHAGCSRCQRLGLECINAKKTRTSLDGDIEPSHPSIVRLERAVEDILTKMKMQPLDAYTHSLNGEPSTTTRLTSEAQASRDNTGDLDEGDQPTGPAPMGSLYEATQLNSLRSRLRRANPANARPRRDMGRDLVSQGLISMKEAEEMLTMYKTVLGRYLFSTTMAEDTTLQQVRESSTLLFTAVMLVSALHIPGKEAIHSACHKHFLELIATSMFERFHTLDDIRALCVAAFWQPDLSWKLSGLAVRMATELNLHQSFYSAFYCQNLSEEQRQSALERARVWYLLYVLDHHFSIAFGRPPVTAELLPIKEWQVFVNSRWSTLVDRRLVSQVNLFVILSKAYEVFGLEPERLMGGDDASLLTHLRFTEDTRLWQERWTGLIMPDKYVGDYPLKGVQLHHHFSNLVLNSLALRGRALDSTLATSLPTPLRLIASRAIEAAHAILEFFLEESSYRDSLVGVPLYLHSMIAFAVVFLIKLAYRWHVIGVTIDAETRTKPLIEGIIAVLKACRAGAGHMVYSMASGFERMMRKGWGKTHMDTLTNGYDPVHHRQPSKRRLGDDDLQAFTNQHRAQLRYSYSDHKRNGFDTNTTSPNTYQAQMDTSLQRGAGSGPFNSPANLTGSPHFGEAQFLSTAGGGMGGYGGYSLGLQDDMLWSAGLGFDLLQQTRQGPGDLDTGYDYYAGGGGSAIGNVSAGIDGQIATATATPTTGHPPRMKRGSQ